MIGITASAHDLFDGVSTAFQKLVLLLDATLSNVVDACIHNIMHHTISLQGQLSIIQ